MVILLDAEKAFNKIQHSFMIKILERAEIQGTYLNIIKAIYSKSAANIKLIKRETQSNLTEIRNKTRLSTVSYLFTIMLEFLGRAIRQQKETKRKQIRKEDIKLLLFADYMIVHITDLKISTKELP